MTQDAFFSAVKRGDIAGAYLFAGEEEYIKERALAALGKKLLPEGFEALNETILTNPTAEGVIEAAETLPMMAERRLVVVRELAMLGAGKAGGESAGSDVLAAYLDRLPDTACIVFYAKGTPDRRKKLTAALYQKAAAVVFERLSDAELAKWMASQLKAWDKKITPESAALLAFTSGRELLVLSQELAKLAAYAGAREAITREDIEAVATKSLECTVFQMIDALSAGHGAEAFSLLSKMLQNGEARIGILAMMARHYRNLLQVKRLLEARVPESEMARRVGVPPFAVRRLIQQARGLTDAQIRARLDLCVDTDYAIKSGRMREDAALERAMLRVVS